MAIKGLKACVSAVLYLVDILPHSCPVGQRIGRQMAAFSSTAGQHMAPRDIVCVCVCKRKNRGPNHA